MKLFILFAILHVGLTLEKTSDEDNSNYWASETIIRKMAIKSNIFNRYATTMVGSYVDNPKSENHETNFTVVLPQKAFISNFTMTVGGENYVANVTGKNEASKTYIQAIKEGKTAGHVVARDTNTFMISTNIPAHSQAEFLLTYEELLERKNNNYELVINIFPGQLIDDFHVEVLINETRPIDFVRTPQLRSGQKIDKRYKRGLKPPVRIVIDEETATVNFTATRDQQRMFANQLGIKESRGLAGQFVVQYDVIRDNYAGELLLQDNFFVHFLAPDDMEPLSKHIVFVLDTSGSMSERTKSTSKNDPKSRKIDQLKDAMLAILNKLQPNDLFTIIEFTHYAYLVDLYKKNKINRINIRNYRNPFGSLNMRDFAPPSTTNNVRDAKQVVNKFVPGGGTNIIGALETALAAIKFAQQQGGVNKNVQPIIMFLTDGKPFGGINDPNDIIRIITDLNEQNQKVPIYSLSFGIHTDQNFLRKLSMRNRGFLRHIHSESDASLQLQSFYEEISVPMLKNVEFVYNSNVINVTRTNFPMLFQGSEITVCGYYNGTDDPVNMVTVKATGSEGNVNLQPEQAEASTVSLERLCAFLTVQQKLEENKVFRNAISTKDAFDLAIKYSFVTDLTSLVVVKPEIPKTGSIITNMTEPDVDPIFDIDFRFGSEEDIQEQNQPQMGVYNVVQGGQSSDEDTLENLKEALPWLTGELLNNNTLTIKKKSYFLGENYSTSSNDTCQGTPVPEVETGICKLLKDCSDVWLDLNTYLDLSRYFCEVDKIYVGVCCP